MHPLLRVTGNRCWVLIPIFVIEKLVQTPKPLFMSIHIIGIFFLLNSVSYTVSYIRVKGATIKESGHSFPRGSLVTKEFITGREATR